MADEKLVRIQRLKAALSSRHVAERDRARHLKEQAGHGISYWSGLLGGSRSFGEKIARHIEESLKLPRYYLDTEGPSLEALEIAELYDQMPEEKRHVLRATANALTVPPPRPGDLPDAELPPVAPTPLLGHRPRTLDA